MAYENDDKVVTFYVKETKMKKDEKPYRKECPKERVLELRRTLMKMKR